MGASSWHSHSFRLVCRCEESLMPSRLLGIWIGPQNHTPSMAGKLTLSGEYDGTREGTFFEHHGTTVETAKMVRFEGAMRENR